MELGVKHVVYGMHDPDVRVAGKGIEILRAQGITIEGPVLRAECEWLNRGFASVRTNGRPWITLKGARTSAGEIAHTDGSEKKITTEEQDRWSHTWLRDRSDAVLVGVHTVQMDDPQLTVRLVSEYKKQNKKFVHGVC